MQRLGLVDDVLQRHGVRNQLIVNDGVLLVGEIIGAQPLAAEVQILRKIMMPLNLGRAFMHAVAERKTAATQLVT